MQVKSHGLAISDYSSCNNNNNNSNTYSSQLVNSFLNKSSPTRHHPPPLLDIVGKVTIPFAFHLIIMCNFNACYFNLQMPDVVSEAATLSLSQMEDLIEDDHHPVHGDPMLSHHLLNSPRSPSSPTSSLHSNDLNLNNHSNARWDWCDRKHRKFENIFF